jgi:hypothetical protein
MSVYCIGGLLYRRMSYSFHELASLISAKALLSNNDSKLIRPLDR